jgi:hypothetical protein
LLLDAPTLAVVAALALGAAVISGIGGFGTGVILAAALAPGRERRAHRSFRLFPRELPRYALA